jgi:hypothetical protein
MMMFEELVFEVLVFEVLVFEVLMFEELVFEVLVFEVLVFEVLVFEVLVFEVLAFELLLDLWRQRWCCVEVWWWIVGKVDVVLSWSAEHVAVAMVLQQPPLVSH